MFDHMREPGGALMAEEPIDLIARQPQDLALPGGSSPVAAGPGHARRGTGHRGVRPPRPDLEDLASERGLSRGQTMCRPPSALWVGQVPGPVGVRVGRDCRAGLVEAAQEDAHRPQCGLRHRPPRKRRQGDLTRDEGQLLAAVRRYGVRDGRPPHPGGRPHPRSSCLRAAPGRLLSRPRSSHRASYPCCAGGTGPANGGSCRKRSSRATVGVMRCSAARTRVSGWSGNSASHCSSSAA
ncbi:hypothetical protein SAMN06272765_6712 [Streptomyces sp. Ag109_G2-15]|nr:hypothetical protein SAMN06272765_6712 [Streptomyces sp. Ag109_G2-15]